MLKEFKEFAMKGNLLDMAIGIILGTAFGKIISSLVADVLMPPIGLLLGKVDFSNLFLVLGDQTFKSLAEAKAAGAPTLNYGIFFNTVLDFVIAAFDLVGVIGQRIVLKLHHHSDVLSRWNLRFVQVLESSASSFRFGSYRATG